MTLFALDSALFKVEIQIVDGRFLASADYFLKMMIIRIIQPSRAKTNVRSMIEIENRFRKVQPQVCWEPRMTDMEYFFAIRCSLQNSELISPPLNIPPR